jgi:subtilisin family serine protease
MRTIARLSSLVLAAGVASAPLGASSASADAAIGINVVLDVAPTESVLAELGRYGAVLDVIPEIRGVTMRATESSLAAIRELTCVAGAGLDAKCELASAGGFTSTDFSEGANHWAIDAIDVTDAGGGRTVPYDGAGVYVAVLDTGLPNNWRAYFPEERIDAEHARVFGGGGGNQGAIHESANWDRDTNGHGAMATAIVIGFRYDGAEPLPREFNGVAPKATVIPVRILNNNENDGAWASVVARGVLYVAGLKESGELGEAPVVISLSLGYSQADALLGAAIDHAISVGVVVVAAGGNEAAAGMSFPGSYAPVISAGASGWRGQFTSDDPAGVAWIEFDVPENDPAEHYIVDFSSAELDGQDLDVVAPGLYVPAPWSDNGQVDHSYVGGTSAAAPHVAGVAALMLQKNPGLLQAEVEAILEDTALALAAGSIDLRVARAGPGNPPTWGDHDNVFYLDATVSWDANVTGSGLVQADAALAATPAN